MDNGMDGLLGILPPWLRREVAGRVSGSLQELRLRLNQPPELILKGRRIWLQQTIRQEDLDFCINSASRYSPWTAATLASGFLTAPGGHRIGVCGEAVIQNGVISGQRCIRSLCIRVARDLQGLAGDPEPYPGSILIIGAPGWGKTTLLRDWIRRLSLRETVCVVDERGELFPRGFDRGKQTDILTGCPKAQGVLQLLRTMGPETIAVDEITDPEDCAALEQADRCGVRLLATAHAGSLQDLKSRKLYAPILPVFPNVFVLQPNQTYRAERMIG